MPLEAIREREEAEGGGGWKAMVVRLPARPARIAASGIIVLGFVFASWAALRPWVAERAASGEPADSATRRALAIDPGNHRIQASLAALYHYSLLLRNYPEALTAYQKVLQLNPLDANAWLHLGKLYGTLGQAREADQAFHLATKLGASDGRLLWEVAVAYLDAGQVQEALAMLTRFLALPDSGYLPNGYELARQLASPEQVLDTMIAPDPTHYTHYANYLLDHNLGDQALAVWNRLNEMTTRTGEPADSNLQLRVVDLLIAMGQPGQAYQVWTNVTKQIEPDAAPTQSNLVSNAGFEREKTVGRGFDWRIGGAPGVVAAFDRATAHTGQRSFRLSFTKSRADFSSASQIVPVQPDSTYALWAYIKTKGLDTSPGVSLEVIDPGHGILARTDPVGETRDWTKVGLTFRTLGKSPSVTLRIHGEPPPAYMDPLSGSAWIDTVTLAKVE